jgi:hypothetical protein
MGVEAVEDWLFAIGMGIGVVPVGVCGRRLACGRPFVTPLHWIVWPSLGIFGSIALGGTRGFTI